MCSKCAPPERVHPSERLLRTRPSFSETVTVSVGVSKLGCIKLFFFCRVGVKINGVFYRDVLLTKKLLPVVRYVSGNEFVFQQNSAPAHRARETIELLRRETRRTLFHRNSGDRTVQILTRWTTLIWATMQQGVYQTKIRNVELRQRLLKVWSSIEQDVIDTSTDQWPWRVRLKACVRLRGRHFEHML